MLVLTHRLAGVLEVFGISGRVFMCGAETRHEIDLPVGQTQRTRVDLPTEHEQTR